MGERVSVMDFLSGSGNKLVSTNELPGHCHDPSQESLMRRPLGQLTKELVGND